MDDPRIYSVRRLTFDAPKVEQISTAIIADLFRCIERFAFRNGEISSLFTSCYSGPKKAIEISIHRAGTSGASGNRC